MRPAPFDLKTAVNADKDITVPRVPPAVAPAAAWGCPWTNGLIMVVLMDGRSALVDGSGKLQLHWVSIAVLHGTGASYGWYRANGMRCDMALKKAEMEEHRRRYQSLMADARTAERAGLYRVAVEKALASWTYVDGMMQYEGRYEDKKDFRSIPAIDLTLKYGPLLLDFASLETLEGLLKDCRRIEKNTSDRLADKLAAARALMWAAHRLWDHLERNPDSRQAELARLLGGEQERWRAIAEAWERMGLLRRSPEGGTYRLALTTRMGEVVSAKCPACGNVTEAPKAMCVEEIPCPECEATVLFVILSSRPETDAKG